jgi:small-conductance mechanosensitive channel
LAASQDLALKDPAPSVSIEEYREQSISLALSLWCKTENYNKLKDIMKESLKALFDQEILSLPSRAIDFAN